MNWFKVHTEARNDAKLRSLSDGQHRVWFHLLCFAAEQEKRGTISGYEDGLLAVEVANGDVALLEETLQTLAQLRIIARNEQAITFINFDKRQYNKPSDNRERTRLRKRRQREREKCRTDVTPCHAQNGVTVRDVRDMSQRSCPPDAVLAATQDEKGDHSKKSDATKHSEDPQDRNGHADITPMSRPVTRSHAIDTDTEVIRKHLSIEDTSVKMNSASPEREEAEEASQPLTLSAPDGAVHVQNQLSEMEAPLDEALLDEPSQDQSCTCKDVPESALPEAGTPGMGPPAGSHHPDAAVLGVSPVAPETGAGTCLPDASPSSKLPDEIAVEELSPRPPYPTIHSGDEGPETTAIGLCPEVSGLPDHPQEQPALPGREEGTTGEPGDQHPVVEPAGESPNRDTKTEPAFFLTKRKRKLSGWKLETFEEFWKAFAYKKGRAEAADAWLDIPNLSPQLAITIIIAAGREANARAELIAKGISPKMAQGWISGRRWEDWEEDGGTASPNQNLTSQEKNHAAKGSQCRQAEESQYHQSIGEAVKRFL